MIFSGVSEYNRGMATHLAANVAIPLLYSETYGVKKYQTSVIVPPPTTMSLSYRTTACPFVMAR